MHINFVHVNSLTFILNTTRPAPPPLQIDISPPGSPRNKRISQFSPLSSKHFEYDTTNCRSYEVRSRLIGEKGIYDFAISSPELTVTIYEITNQIFDELYGRLCSSYFLEYNGAEALERGLLKVIVRGTNQMDHKHNESLKPDTSVGMMKYMFEHIEFIEFQVRSGLDDPPEKEEHVATPAKRLSDKQPSVMGWTITKPITHTPEILLNDPEGKVQSVRKSITLSDASNITFSDLFFVHCTSTFAAHQGEEARLLPLPTYLVTSL